MADGKARAARGQLGIRPIASACGSTENWDELIEDEELIHVCRTRRRIAHARGRRVDGPRSCNAVPERFEVPSYEKELETRDLIESCCTCDEERTFVAMREAAYTLERSRQPSRCRLRPPSGWGRAGCSCQRQIGSHTLTNDPAHLPGLGRRMQRREYLEEKLAAQSKNSRLFR